MHVPAPILLRTVALSASLLLALHAPVAAGQGAPAAPAIPDGARESRDQPPAPPRPAGAPGGASEAGGGSGAATPSRDGGPTATEARPAGTAAAAVPATGASSGMTAPASSARDPGRAGTAERVGMPPANVTRPPDPGGAVRVGDEASQRSARPASQTAIAPVDGARRGIVPRRPRRDHESQFPPAPPSHGSRWRIAGAAELGLQPIALTPRTTEVFAGITPILALGYDGVFALELGAPMRTPLGGRSGAQPFTLRDEDWDERSDFGQILRALRIGRETDAFSLWAGPLTLETLGRGALVSRYGNRMLATQSPAGARLRAEVGAVRTEVLASDVLALRLLAAEVRLDGGHLLGGGASAAGRWHVTLGAAHEAGQVEAASAPITLASLELDGVLWRLPTFQFAAFLGGGARLGAGGGHLGGQAGVEFEAQLSDVVFGSRLAARRGSGGYRPGFFGADHELARLAGQGLTTAPLDQLRLPTGYSGYGLVQLGFGAQGEEDVPDARSSRGTASVAVEVFQSGRTDLEAAYQFDLSPQGFSAAGRLGVTGLGETPRTWASVEGRGRLTPSIYLLAAAGTAFAPREGGGLTRGWTATLGVGFDFEARP